MMKFKKFSRKLRKVVLKLDSRCLFFCVSRLKNRLNTHKCNTNTVTLFGNLINYPEAFRPISAKDFFSNCMRGVLSDEFENILNTN